MNTVLLAANDFDALHDMYHTYLLICNQLDTGRFTSAATSRAQRTLLEDMEAQAAKIVQLQILPGHIVISEVTDTNITIADVSSNIKHNLVRLGDHDEQTVIPKDQFDYIAMLHSQMQALILTSAGQAIPLWKERTAAALRVALFCCVATCVELDIGVLVQDVVPVYGYNSPRQFLVTVERLSTNDTFTFVIM